MADIELVIKIPEEDYIKISNSNPSYADDFNLYYAIKNGTPLPKGHGRLIDADELIEGKVANDWTRIQAECANTIIEADKGESEDKE